MVRFRHALLTEHQPKLTRRSSSGIALSACTGLQTLFLSFTPHFSMDTHARHVRALLSSWNSQLPHPACLVFRTYRDWEFTRRGFADVLRGLGTIAEPWLQTVESTHSGRVAQYQLVVNICDSEAARKWWSDHIDACFPTWLRLGRLRWNFEAREYYMDISCGNHKFPEFS